MQDPHIVEKGHAPTPFTASEIAAGCPPGRTVTSRVRTEGEEALSRMTFGPHTSDGVVLTTDQGEYEVGWIDLQRHASFPEEITTIAHELVETPLGRLDCLHYVVERGSETAEFWFDRSRPGLPVRHLTASEGVVTYFSEVIEDESA